MELTWLGHASFRLDAGGKRIYIDPFLNGNPKCPDNEQTPERAIVVDELLGCARRIAFEALPVEGGRDGPLRSSKRSEVRPVLARDRQHQSIVSLGPAVGEKNIHVRQSCEIANVRREL